MQRGARRAGSGWEQGTRLTWQVRLGRAWGGWRTLCQRNRWDEQGMVLAAGSCPRDMQHLQGGEQRRGYLLTFLNTAIKAEQFQLRGD